MGLLIYIIITNLIVFHNPTSVLTSLVASSILIILLHGVNGDEPRLNVKCTTEHCRDLSSSILESADFDIDPCVDFYTFACANFPEQNPIPDGRYLWDNFQILQNYSDEVTRDILSSPKLANEPTAVHKAKSMYHACMDTASLDSIGLIPLLDVLSNVGGWPLLSSEWSGELGWQKLAAIIAEYGVPMVFEIVVRANLLNANQTIIYLENPGLALPVPLIPLDPSEDVLDRYQALLDSKMTRETDSYYTLYMNKIALKLRDHLGTTATDEDIIRDLREVIQFMRALTSVLKASEETSTSDAPSNGAVTFATLQAWTDQLSNDTTTISWLDFFHTIYSNTDVELTPQDSIYISDVGRIGRIVELFSMTEPRVIANFVVSRLMVYLSPETDDFMRNAAFQFYKEQSYVPPNYERWQYCVHKVNDYPKIGLSMAVAYQLQENDFDKNKLTKSQELIGDLRSAFQELLSENSWMDESTRFLAASKADALIVLQGFPSWLNDSLLLDQYYEKMEIEQEDHFSNTYRLRTSMQAINLASVARVRDRFEWTQSPLIVNAFYNGLNNRITFPAGIMYDPFFNGDNIGAFDYGRIGAIIGHEITHGFDSSGRFYDYEGTLSAWWSTETSNAFAEKEKCFIEQYSNYLVAEINQTVNGVGTKQENVADNGGLREAYRAFQRLRQRDKIRGDARLTGLEHFTPDQLFYLAYATMWCRAETPQGLISMTRDSHSPNRFRVIGTLSNMVEFSEAWNCAKNAPMNPVDKCVLW